MMYSGWERRLAMADTKNGVGSLPEPDDADDLRARFARAEQAAQNAPLPSDLPHPPDRVFTRPVIKEVSPIQQGKIGRVRVADVSNAGMSASVGISLFAAVGGGVLMGALADKFLLGQPATPWGLITGFFVGLFVSGYQLARLMTQIKKEDKPR